MVEKVAILSAENKGLGAILSAENKGLGMSMCNVGNHYHLWARDLELMLLQLILVNNLSWQTISIKVSVLVKS